MVSWLINRYAALVELSFHCSNHKAQPIQCIPNTMHTVHVYPLTICTMFCCGLALSYVGTWYESLTLFDRVTSLLPGQFYDCPYANDVDLNRWWHKGPVMPWWRHLMETFSALLALCEGIHRSPLDSPNKGQWREAFVFSLICAWTNSWANNRDAGVLRSNGAHCDVIVIEEYE